MKEVIFSCLENQKTMLHAFIISNILQAILDQHLI